MFAISYIFAYSFNIVIRMQHSIVLVRGPPDPFQVFYSGSDDTIDPVSYIVYLRGRVPERYELWGINASGVREVHLFARVRPLDDSSEDTFNNFFFNSRRCRITFIGRRSLNGSFEFIHFSDVTSDAEVVISTPNLFVHKWGNYPTMLWPTVSNFNPRAYVPITTQKGFRLQCNHERLRLNIFYRKRVALENHIARIRQDVRDDVAANYVCSPVNHALGDASPANSPRPPSSNDSDSGEN